MENTQPIDAAGHEKPVQKDKEVSTENFFRFIRFTPQSFAGIHKDMNLAIVFDEPSKRVLGFTGDQGTRKTSALQALHAALGGMPPKNALNKEDNSIDNELVFENGNVQYIVRQTTKQYTVHSVQGDQRSKLDKPKEFLKKVIGPIGLNPMDLKTMKGKDQIEWIREITPFSKEQLDGEQKLLAEQEKDYKSRTEKKKTAKGLVTEIVNTGYYTYTEAKDSFWPTAKHKEDTIKVSSSELDENVVSEKSKAAEKAKDAYRRAEQEMETLAQNKKFNTNKIDDLKRQLAEAEAQGAQIDKRIEDGNKYLADNANAITDFDAVQKELVELSDVKLKFNNLKSVTEKTQKYADTVSEIKELDKKLDKHQVDHKAFIKSFTPNIEGFEIVVAGIEQELRPLEEGEEPAPVVEKRAEGIYYNGKTMLMLSESELFELYIQLLAFLNIRVAIIENITSLGTAAIERINWFAEQMGGYVFYSAMERGKEKLGFQFIDKIK